MLVGITVPLVIYLITVIMVIGGLSINGVETRTWPTLDLMRSFEMQGLIFERFESLACHLDHANILDLCDNALCDLARMVPALRRKYGPFSLSCFLSSSSSR